MKLASFSVTNFRSITQTHKIDLSWSNVTVFVWKNNEGKSNILKALNICMNVIKIPMFRYADPSYIHRDSLYYARDYYHDGYKFRRDSYFWERDFPIKLREKESLETNFLLEFFLTKEDATNIKLILWKKRLKIDRNLVVHISFNKQSKPNITIDWIDKCEKVITYISENIDFTYIPAIRTEREILSMINDRISVSLHELEKDKGYEKAINMIKKKQDIIFRKIEKLIQWQITPFIPNVKKVKIKRKDNSVQLDFWSIADLFINDWTETEIEYKWDWIKSLVSISLLHKLWDINKSWLVAIEEPEAHLHPEAMHYLNDVINDLWNSWQILISTHNPLFINRSNIKSNIIVGNWEAKPAENLKEIRNIIWVKISDNLIHTEKVLVVEWDTDAKSLYSIFSCNTLIKKALKSWKFSIIPLKSSTHLEYELTRLKEEMVEYKVLLDFDEAWKKAYEQANWNWLIEEKDRYYTKCFKRCSEFEDWIDCKIYKQKIKETFNVDISNISKSNKMWSAAMKKIFDSQGKEFDDKNKIIAKIIVAESVEEFLKNKRSPNKALYKKRADALLKLVTDIEEFIKQ